MSIERAVKYFVSVGWTLQQAAGIAANLQAESNFNPSIVGDGGLAYGIAQWHPPRQAIFGDIFSKSIVGSTLEEQLAFVHWELTNTELPAGAALGKCTTAAEAGACVSRMYERPRDTEGEAAKRATLAMRIAGEQPPVPVEDRSIPFTEPTTEAPMEPNTVVTAIPAIVGMFNPLIGGLLSALSPLVTGKLTKLLTKQVDNPDQAAQIAASLTSTLLGQARALTGKPDDFQAVAAITADPAQAENRAKLEAALDAEIDRAIDRLAKAGDKMIVWDQAYWQAQNEGKNTVSSIAIAEKRAGVYDMTRLLAWSGTLVATLGTFMLLVPIIVQSMSWAFAKDTRGIDPVLLALAGPLLALTFKGWISILEYRFDGSKESSAQSQAMTAAITNKR